MDRSPWINFYAHTLTTRIFNSGGAPSLIGQLGQARFLIAICMSGNPNNGYVVLGILWVKDFVSQGSPSWRKGHRRQKFVTDLDQYMVRVSGNTRKGEYKCTLCGKMSTSKDWILWPPWEQALPRTQEYDCDRCKKKFDTNTKLANHRHNHCPPTFDGSWTKKSVDKFSASINEISLCGLGGQKIYNGENETFWVKCGLNADPF